MAFIERIKDMWPLVTKARFNRLKSDRDALLKEHKNMSDHVLEFDEKIKNAVFEIKVALKHLGHS